MFGVWQDLLANMAIIVAVITLWANVRNVMGRRTPRAESIIFGLVMSGGALLAMMLAAPFIGPGILLDIRAAPLAVAGFFGGPLAAAIAAGPALVYRIALGGHGAPTGCLGIVSVAVLGPLVRSILRDRTARHADIVLLAVMTALVNVLTVLALPPKLIIPTMLHVGTPSACLDIVGVLLAGLALLGEERRRDLASANALYRAIIETLPDCLNVKALDGRFIAANPATARLMHAASADDLIGKTDFDFYPRETAKRFRDDEAAALRAADPSQAVEQQAVFSDGRAIWLSTLKVPFRDEAGRIVGLITHNRDVTVAKRLQVELQNARRHLAEALANMADGLVLYDETGRILICNEQYRQLFPRTADLRVEGANLSHVLRQSVARGEERLPPGVSIETWVATVLGHLRDTADRVIELADDRWIEARTRPIAGGGSLTVFSDVTLRKRTEEALRHQAEHDPLTGLANRAAFESHLQVAFDQARQESGEFAVLLIDLDRFKQVNDRFGHAAGDRLLTEVGRRLTAACRHGDLVARLGGDEFAVLSTGHNLQVGAARLSERILDSLAQPFLCGSITLLPGGSIGYALYPGDPSPPDLLIAHADEALYAAKAAGRRQSVAYSGSATARAEAG